MARIDDEQWPELGPLLDQALELTATERDTWLRELRGRSPQLAASLDALLLAEVIADQRGFLEPPKAAGLAGTELDHYTLVRPLGHGGMGSVWLARRTDGRFDGFAAVKLMNLALMSESGQMRFRREGTALARLSHHAIARLLDAGVAATGQPYLVLEYVDGQHIDAYADAAGLSLRQRIELMLQVLDAVGHAHVSLIVHRDLKPSNILVTAEGQVKLLDFGIAKLLVGDGEDERAAQTADGDAVLTPEYASPEQIRSEAVTTATDVYALGVLLYLLVSGRHPTREPHSTAIQAASSILDVEPRALGHGDLDTILGKALRKVPGERYATVAAFADDLQRYRRHEPVSARPDSLGYRTRKFLRRHRAAVAVATMMIVVLLSATVFSFVQARRASEQRDVAIRAARRAVAMTELQSVFASDGRGADGLPLTPANRIALAEEVLVRRFRNEPWLVSEILTSLSASLYESFDRESERAMLARAGAIAREGRQHEQVALAACTRATSFWYDDATDSVMAELRQARAALATVGHTADPILRSVCLEAEGKALLTGGNGDSAVTLLRQAVALLDSESGEAHRLPMLLALSEVLRLAGRYREASAAQLEHLNALEQAGYGNTEGLPNMAAFVDRTLSDMGEYRVADSILGALIRKREAVAGAGRAPQLLAFLHGQGQMRLGAIDSADVWITRATRGPYPEGGTMSNWLPSVLAQIRVGQGRISEARAAAAGLPGGLRGRRANAALVNALVEHASGRKAVASARLEHELAALYAESPITQSLFTMPLVTAGEWRLATGDARGADSLGMLAWRAAALDSLAPTRSALAGRSDLLRAKALLAIGDSSGAKASTERAVIALGNGYGANNRWTIEARALRVTLPR